MRYWGIKLDEPIRIGFDEAANHFRELFLDNIRLHLRSDVPVGSALSGGLDSSSVVMGMRKTTGEALDQYSFSYIAADSSFDEEKWVDIVGKAAAVNVKKTYPDQDELIEDLDHLITVQDEPFGSTSIYAQHRVFRLASENGIKVMEDGQGADELLGGYNAYYSVRLASLLRKWKLGQAGSFTPRSGIHRDP